MDNKCPTCNEDLLKIGTKYVLAKNHKIIFHWIKSAPIECNKCHQYLEKNQHKAEAFFGLFAILAYLTFTLLVYYKVVTSTKALITALLILATLLITKEVVCFKLKNWPRYKVFENKNIIDLVFGVLIKTIFYVILLLPIIVFVFLRIES